jgi:peptide/nickel transport system permease protein
MGMTERQLLIDDFLPNIMPFVMIRFANAAKGIIYASVALYFLGLLPSSGANWGVQMNTAYNLGNALSRPEAMHWLLAPMLTIIILSWALATFAQGADRIFNPRIRTRVADDD